MIFEGLKLAIIGMLVVFSFLILLVLIVKISAVLLKPLTEKEERELMIRKRKKTARNRSMLGEGRLTAVISAAVAAHRSRMRTLKQG